MATQDPAWLSYPLTALSALGALGSLTGAAVQVILRRRTPCHVLLVGVLNSCVCSLISCLALLILMVAGEAGARELCLTGGTLLLVAILVRFLHDCCVTGMLIMSFKRRLTIFVPLMVLLAAWLVIALPMFLTLPSSTVPTACLPIYPGHPHSVSYLVAAWTFLAMGTGLDALWKYRYKQQWSVHPSLLLVHFLFLLPSSVLTASVSTNIRLPLRWILFYLAACQTLVHLIVFTLRLRKLWIHPDPLLNPRQCPTRLRDLHVLSKPRPYLTDFLIRWSKHRENGAGHLRVFAPSARHLWSKECKTAFLLSHSPHVNVAKYLWTVHGAQFAGDLNRALPDSVSPSSRFVCREHYDRGTLENLLRDDPHCLSEGFIHQTCMDIARALVHLRSLNLLHESLSPQTIWLQTLSDGSLRAVLCDFHQSSHLRDISLNVDGLADTSLVYSLSSRSGFMDALRDNQFASDVRSLALILIHMLLSLLDRGHALILARASVSPALERVAEEEETKEGDYEDLGPLGPLSAPKKFVHGRRMQNGDKVGFDNAGYDSSMERGKYSHQYENLPSNDAPPTPHSGGSADSLSGDTAHPDLVKTAMEQRRMLRQQRRQSPSMKALTPTTTASLSLLNGSTSSVTRSQPITGHEAEYCLRVAREHPKWIDVGAMLNRDLIRIRNTARAMRMALSQFGGDMAEAAVFAWLSDPCISADGLLSSLKNATPRSAV